MVLSDLYIYSVDTKYLGSFFVSFFLLFSLYFEIRSSVTVNFQSVTPDSLARCLILMVDTRPLDHDLSTASYNSISAVINADYANRFGCEFKYLIPFLNINEIVANFESEWERKGPKLRPSCYHPLLKTFRAGPWAKLLAVWEAADSGVYGNILYIDSDAILIGNESLTDYFQDYRRKSIYGASINVSRAIFFSNAHWGREKPCSGVFLLRPVKGGADFIRHWWDFSAPDKDFVHPFEQEALWRSSDLSYKKDSSEIYHLGLIRPDDYSVIEDDSFSFQLNSCLWVCHVTGEDEHRRKEIMLHWLRLSNYTDEMFESRIIGLESSELVMPFDSMTIATFMSNRSKMIFND